MHKGWLRLGRVSCSSLCKETLNVPIYILSLQEALYDLLRLQNVMEDEHSEEVMEKDKEIMEKDKEIENLKHTVESLARRQSKSFGQVNCHCHSESFLLRVTCTLQRKRIYILTCRVGGRAWSIEALLNTTTAGNCASHLTMASSATLQVRIYDTQMLHCSFGHLSRHCETDELCRC